MTLIALAETGSGVDCALSTEQAQALARSGVVEVRPGDAVGVAGTRRGVALPVRSHR